MNEELIKELKDAGFPWKQHHSSMGVLPREMTWDDEKYSPTLSELIEACGEALNGLIRKGDTVWLAAGGKHIGFYGDEFLIQGATPEEAVARLWLALQSKGDGI